jgi:hypothetical protein
MKAGVENSRICVKMCNEALYKLNDHAFLYMSTDEFLKKKRFFVWTF